MPLHSTFRYTVMVDLDSTICDTRQRWHLINQEDRDATDWQAYAMACADDEPMEGTIALMRLLHSQGVYIVILSGRYEAADVLTMEWLYDHEVPFHELLLRSEQDHTPNEAFKVVQARNWMARNPMNHVALLIDDWPPVEDVFRNEMPEVPVLLVNPRYDEENGDAEEGSQ